MKLMIVHRQLLINNKIVNVNCYNCHHIEIVLAVKSVLLNFTLTYDLYSLVKVMMFVLKHLNVVIFPEGYLYIIRKKLFYDNQHLSYLVFFK